MKYVFLIKIHNQSLVYSTHNKRVIFNQNLKEFYEKFI